MEKKECLRSLQIGPQQAVTYADQWRAEAKDKGLSIRQFVSSKTARIDATFTGSYTAVADRLAEYARVGAVDGFNISPWLIPTGLDDIVNHLVPELQQRGVYPPEYAGCTLRENLGLDTPVRSADETVGAVRAS